MTDYDYDNLMVALRRIEELLRRIERNTQQPPIAIHLTLTTPADFTAGEIAEVVKRGMEEAKRLALFEAAHYSDAPARGAATAEAGER